MLIDGITYIAARLPIGDGAALKNLASQLDNELEIAVIVFGAEINGKPQVLVNISKSLVQSKGLHAGNIVRELAKEIGGGQPFFATAGGSDLSGLDRAVAKAKELVFKAYFFGLSYKAVYFIKRLITIECVISLFY